MSNSDKQLREELLNEITNSNMTITRKLKVMQLLDKAFRKYLDVMYLSDDEIQRKDILSRSM